MNNNTMSIALTNLGQYNEGILNFTWLELPATDEEITRAFDKISVSHDDTHYYSDGLGHVTSLEKSIGEYEEWFITDYECAFYQIGEYESLEKLNEIAEKLDDMSDYEADIVRALLNEGYTLDEALDKKDDCIYWSDCNDMTDVAYQYVEECDLLHDVPDSLKNYFDYEAFGRDLSYSGHWIATDDGYIEVA